MKIALTLLAALLWQAGDFGASGVQPAAETQHLRYERALELPSGVSGAVCAVLDANVYAHAGSWSEGDLRIFGSVDGKRQEEVPFAVSYSEAQPTDAVTATVQDLNLQNGVLDFDLEMPQRAYTVVDLKLAAENFLATAEVSGSNGRGEPGKALGTFTLFDLTKEHLARSTSLALQESSFAQLHVRLRMRNVDGGKFSRLSTEVVEGATVPASREAQTLYTVVATGTKVKQNGDTTLAQIEAPAHVPIERVNFLLDPAYTSDFLRSISIVAEREGMTQSPEEKIDGEIWRVTRKGDGEGDPAIHDSKMTVIAVIASNVRESAKITVRVQNAGQRPLPIKAVQLEMRQRTVCFDAAPGATYMLRYGDDALRASVYDHEGDHDGLSKMLSKPAVAALGPEELNPYYVKRSDSRRYDERNPELYWILLLAVISVLGALASGHTKRQGRHR